MKFTQLHKQALLTSALTIIVLAILFIVPFYLLNIDINTNSIIILLIIAFVLVYVIFRYGVKRLISIYRSSIFENESSFSKQGSETDFESFLKELKEYTAIKHREIETLHNRDDFRREFLGDVSHELKTPLFTAQAYLLTLMDESLLDKKLRYKYLKRANRSIERLNFIVKDLDMISKLESGMTLKYETFSIIQLITEVLEILEIKAGKKNISLTFDKYYDFPLLVRADEERIEQVLINLISNSINYGEINGTTTISMQSFSKNKIIIKVSDNGSGIEKNEIPRLFERFYRIDKSRSREQGGSGLGLAIVKHIIEAHDQEVFTESTIGQGSVFSFTLNKVL